MLKEAFNHTRSLVMKRETSVAGTFYPARAIEIERYFEHFSKVYDESLSLPKMASRAVIVPHAGYIYSGYTANVAYRILQNSKVKNILVIGPSHRMAFDGVSLGDYESYETPFGEIQGAKNIQNDLKKRFALRFIKDAHREHSTEVQFPFLKYYLEDVKIVELIYSNASSDLLSDIIGFTLQNEDCGVVISTDLSHFYNIDYAHGLDNLCLNAIENLDTNTLGNGCEACGFIGVEAMIKSAIKLRLHSNILDYRTSADASDDTDRVVGYVSACFTDMS